ncbi:tRNA preQ1(34) S-adenosylmethionine ribosyltransferase-isomerase QueA [Hellea sp.]|nr:tRNA preQ1(34) S-adenosylmethionine ribosyltransferase-isomerase QueA [Hellea sp.]
MRVSAFDFHLPEESIALRPARPRDSAKLLQVSAQGKFTDHIVKDLPSLLREGDVLVLNETKVLRAALTATRSARAHGGGGDVTVDVNLHTAVSDTEWRAFVRPAKRLRDGDEVHFSPQLSATVFGKQEGGDVGLRFNLAGPALSAAIEATGQPPLPPYIARKRAPDAKDVADYQTVYADGDAASVAAPTAGLHFTPDVFAALGAKGVQIERLTLHVGAGTFLPVKSDDTKDHHMHSEWYQISPETAVRINQAKSEGRRIIAVGTTALRALESSAVAGQVKTLTDDTQIFITPGSDFHIIDGLMTNFHLPKSTLFMLVSALAGLEVMQAAYGYAIENGYRFYSYGDSSLLWAAEN